MHALDRDRHVTLRYGLSVALRVAVYFLSEM